MAYLQIRHIPSGLVAVEELVSEEEVREKLMKVLSAWVKREGGGVVRAGEVVVERVEDLR